MRHVPVATTLSPDHDHVTALEQLRGPVTVIRRCETMAELVSVARAGLAEAVLVAHHVDQLTLTFLESLEAGSNRPVAVVALADVPSERSRIAGLGLPVAAPDRPADELAEMIIEAVERTRTHGTARWGEGEPFQDAAFSEAQELDRLLMEDPKSSDTAVQELPDQRDRTLRQSASEREPDGVVTRRGARSASAVATTRSDDDRPPPARAADPVGSSPSDRADEGGSSAAASSWPKPRRGWTRIFRRSGGSSDPVQTGGPEEATQPASDGDSPRITTVWGPAGSPGRTTVAVNLAVEIALTGRSTLLIDLDTYAASVAVHLGLLEETAGIARACHAADQGRLSPDALRRLSATARVAGASLDVLTGLTRAERWPELRGQALEAVLDSARQGWEEIVVDVGFCLEADEELTFDVPAPQRNAATLAGLAAADRILAVGTGDAVGLPRLIRGLDELETTVSSGQIEVVLNQVRSESSGAAPQAQLKAVWDRFGPERQISCFLPWDRKSLDRALLSGQVLAEAAPNSPLRAQLSQWTARV